jgi:hypothetical protein
MRYNPATDRAISIDEIAAQCRAAILKADEDRQFSDTMEQIADLLFGDDLYAEVLTAARWEDDMLIAA